MFSKPTVKSCFLASKKMFQASRFHYLLLFSLSISKIDNDFNLDAKILILKIKRVGPSQYPHTHTSRPCLLDIYVTNLGYGRWPIAGRGAKAVRGGGFI